MLKEKLELLKGKLKIWNDQNCRFLKNIEMEAVIKIKELDSKDDGGTISLSEAQLKKKKISKFWEASRKQEALLFQKSRFR